MALLSASYGPGGWVDAAQWQLLLPAQGTQFSSAGQYWKAWSSPQHAVPLLCPKHPNNPKTGAIHIYIPSAAHIPTRTGAWSHLPPAGTELSVPSYECSKHQVSMWRSAGNPNLSIFLVNDPSYFSLGKSLEQTYSKKTNPLKPSMLRQHMAEGKINLKLMFTSLR